MKLTTLCWKRFLHKELISCGSGVWTHVVRLMRPSWNHLQSIPQCNIIINFLKQIVKKKGSVVESTKTMRFKILNFCTYQLGVIVSSEVSLYKNTSNTSLPYASRRTWTPNLFVRSEVLYSFALWTLKQAIYKFQ